MTHLVLTAAWLVLLWLSVAVLALLGHHRAEIARAKADAALCAQTTTLLRVLRAASEGRLQVTRESNGYHISEIVSHPGAAPSAERGGAL